MKPIRTDSAHFPEALLCVGMHPEPQFSQDSSWVITDYFLVILHLSFHICEVGIIMS